MNGHWKDLFAFNKRERNGIFVLCVLILLLLLIQVVMPYYVKLPEVDNTAALDAPRTPRRRNKPPPLHGHAVVLINFKML